MNTMENGPYINQARQITRTVWFDGSGALKKGMGVCYDRDYYSTETDETATDPCQRRDKIVQVPTTTNNLRFAGVAIQDYPAKTGGQTIEIYEPGSVCEVAIGRDTVLASQTRLTCSASTPDAGRFTQQGFDGRGTAIALQTNASGNVFSSLAGGDTAAYSGGVFTITATGVGTACGYGDDTVDPTVFKVVLLGGADDATGGDAAADMVEVGEYPVLTAPTADTITVDVSDMTDPNSQLDVTFYIYSGNPLALCLLMDGPESGLQEFISPRDNTAVEAMVGGVTFICGGYTMAADSTATLADGVIEGLKKGYVCLGALGTQDYLITVTSGLQADQSTGLATMEFDAAGDFAILEWHGSAGMGGITTGVWQLVTYVGPTLA